MSLPRPGTGYFIASDPPGPGVLVLHSAWGLTDGIKQRCGELADVGYSVLAPDLNDGFVAEDDEAAIAHLQTADMNVAASLVQSSARLLRPATNDPAAPLAVVGYAMGASWALWLSARMPELCRAVVGFSGTQSIDFDSSRSAYLLHFGTDDTVVTDAEIAHVGLSLKLARRPFHIVHADGAGHGFAEPNHANHAPEAAAISWRETLEFLAEHHHPNR